MSSPKWVNPTRQAYLVELWEKYGNKCRYGHLNCSDASHYAFSKSRLDNGKRIDYKVVYQTSDNDGIERYLNDYDICSEKCVKNWIESDRDQTYADYRIEYESRHNNLSDRKYPLHGKFNGIARDIYYDNSPVYRIEVIGIDGISHKPVAKIRLVADSTILFVDISKAMQSETKNQKRKALKHSKINPLLQSKIDDCLNKAVTHYLSNIHGRYD